jgi:hypothetical protein
VKITRRTFGRGAIAAAALAAIAGRARAGGAGRARRLHVLYASGGMRSSAGFNASDAVERNPWGIATTTPLGVRLGNLWTADGSVVAPTWTLPSWGGATVPDLAAIAPSFAMIGATDHRPDGSTRAGDHGDDSPRMGTGDYSGLPGLLTVINRYLGDAAPAPVMQNGGPFGRAPGDWQASQPTSFIGYQMPSSPPPSGRPDVGRVIEDAIDARYRDARRGLGRATVDVMLSGKRTMRRFGPLLADPLLRPSRVPDAELGGITNRMLMEAIGATGDLDDLEVAIGLRILQMGSPAAVISIGGFDLHSEEMQKAPRLYARWARYLCGIHFALSNIAEPDGTGMMIDHTLVCTASEFGRSQHSGGFNEGDGSDHGDDPSWRYQPHVLFGAGVRPKVIYPVDVANEPTDGICSTQALLFTLAAAVGAPEGELERVWPSATALHPETSPLWELWE